MFFRDRQIKLLEKLLNHVLLAAGVRPVIAVGKMIKTRQQKSIPVANDANG